MTAHEPTIFQMARALFQTSVISPLVAGTLLAIAIQHNVNVLGSYSS